MRLLLARVLRGLSVHRWLARAGDRLLLSERNDTAELYFQAATRIAPDDPAIWIGLATALQCRHVHLAAIDALEKALALAPDNQEANQRLGHAAMEAEQWSRAIAQFERLLAEHPLSAEYHYHLACAYKGAGRLHDAVDLFRAALAIEEVASTHNGLGLVLSELARQQESLPHFHRAAELSDKPAYISNLLFTLCYDATLSPDALYRQHVEQAARLGTAQVRQWRQSFAPERRLRIGYVSPDLRFHPVAFFLEPVLKHHDGAQFEVFAYSTQKQHHSETSMRLKALCAAWREFDDAESEQLADAILADQIDILIDLAGHTANNSLPLMSRRLAPVQAGWLGYLNTTGLAAMDYRITDATACPPSLAAPLHNEKLAYLPDAQWCYQAPPASPDVAPLPALANGIVTFGALHNPAKVGEGVIALWAKLLVAVPNSRLLLASRGFARIADETRARFAALGVAPDRIEIRDRMPFVDYLAMHNEIDINLDAFPYTGGTTTCHSLWMGVPVLTLAANTVMGRGGVSLLNAAGMSDWVAESEAAYLAIGQQQVANLAQLAGTRRRLRQQLLASPLMQAAPFTRHLEALYRAMWRERCALG